jgi:hypothetical protein
MKAAVVSVCLLCALTLAASGLGVPKPPSTEPLPDWFWGCWVVKRDLEVKDIFGLSPRQEKRILGKRIVFTPTCARWRRVVLSPPKYSVKVESAEHFFRHGTYNDLDEIGVSGDHVTEVELDLPGNLSDLDFPGAYMYLRKKDIVLVVEGVYLLAEKAKVGDPKCGCKVARAK